MPAIKKKSSPANDVTFRPLEKKRYSEQIADLIQNKILTEHLEIGTNLPSEKDLAQEFGVSRSVIRESLRILEISGLVDIKKGPTGGIFVADVYHKPITLSLNNMIISGEVTMDHLFDIRLLIEPHIAANAALNAKKGDLQKIEDLFADSERHFDDAPRLKRNSLKFHLLLAKACDNPVLALLLESLFELLIKLSFDVIDLSQGRYFHEQHREIFRAVKEKQTEKVSKLIKKDILDIKKRLDDFKRLGPR